MQNWFQLLFCLCLLCYVISYNVETSGETIKYLLSPLQQKLARTKDGERPPPTPMTPGGGGPIATLPPIEPGPHPSDSASSFFGYDVTITPNGKSFSAVIGAPKTNNAADPTNQPAVPPISATGDISTCPLGDIFTSLTPFCPSNNPPGMQPGDSFGIGVGAAPNGRKTACSPTKTQNCTVVRYSPGYCYNQETPTSSWIPDPETKKKKCPSYALDLMFVLDGSGSVGHKNFETVKKWVKDMAANFDISDGSARIGVIQYSHYYDDKAIDDQPYIVTEVALGRFTNQTALDNAIDQINLTSFTTYTAHALNKSVKDFEKSDRFETASKVLILLTDGRSSDSHLLADTADYVRSLGIKTIAVGVGEAEKSELRTIATGTQTDENVYQVTSFNQLNLIVNQLKSVILTFALEGSGAKEAAYKLELSETGFSIEPSKKSSPV